MGDWDVVVTNPNWDSATRGNGFRIETPRPPQLAVDFIGLDRIRIGGQQTYTVRCTNSGDIDAEDVVVVVRWLAGQAGRSFAQHFLAQVMGVLLDDKDDTFWDAVRRVLGNSFRDTIGDLVPGADLVWIWDGSQSVLQSVHEASTADLLLSKFVEYLRRFLPEMSYNEAVKLTTDLRSALTRAGLTPQKIKIAGWTLVAIEVTEEVIRKTRVAVEETSGIERRVEKRIQPVQSIDPNAKLGPPGLDPQAAKRYISATAPVSYTVLFENLATATASAQEVTVIDSLDTWALDQSTVSLGYVRFGDKAVIPPTGAREFKTEVDLRPAQNLLVRVAGQADAATGAVTWRLTSIDPATGLPPADPLAGFLPPNRVPPQGEGSVSFTALPRQSSFLDGADVHNRASIIFDKNQPLETPEWINTIDAQTPASRVAALTPVQDRSSFTVQWSGTDEGAGIRDYSVFVSENGGAYRTWLRDTTATSGVFAAQPGRVYAFYSVARDRAGNLETAPDDPDTETRVPAAGV